MSFFYPNEKVYNDKIKTVYKTKTIFHKEVNEFTNDLNDTLISKNTPIEGELIKHKDTYFRINFSSKEPNFVDPSINPSKYTSEFIYLFGLLHNNIINVSSKAKDIVGEIVIQHTNPNSQEKVFVCYLIKETNEEKRSNNLDKFVKFIQEDVKQIEANFSLDESTPSQNKCVNYTDKNNNHIYIYTNPIRVNKKTAELFKKTSVHTSLFDTNAPLQPKYIDLLGDNKNIKEEFGNIMEGIENQNGIDDEIYIDCQPTGESDENILAYSIPVDSEYTDSKTKIEFFKTAMYFMFFIIITAIVNIFVPAIYKQIVIDKINKWSDVENINFGKHKKIRDADILLSSIYFAFTFSLLGIPMSYTSGSTSTNYAPVFILFLFVYYVMSFALIQGKKAETNFMKTEGSPESAGLYSDLINKELTLIPFGALTLIIEMLKLYSSDMAAFSTALITIMSIILYFTTNWSWFVFAWSSTFISTVFVPLIYLLST
tara:strand:+ start:658 stop:2112 length:1455 start_codon:yes stop_codon:yes gene_type:complete